MKPEPGPPVTLGGGAEAGVTRDQRRVGRCAAAAAHTLGGIFPKSISNFA